MSDARPLLELQAVDTELTQVRRRLETLPERGALAELDAADAADRREHDGLEERRHEMERRQRRLEDEVDGLRERRQRDAQRLSTIVVPREAEAVQAEIASLERRVAELEDEVLALMEAIEPLDARLAELADARAAREQPRAELTTALTEAAAELDARVALLGEQRSEIVGRLDPELVRTYDQLHARESGAVVGRLDGHTCTACALTLPPVEVEKILDHPEGTAVPCECGRALLIR